MPANADYRYDDRRIERDISQLLRAREEAHVELAQRLHLTFGSVMWLEEMADQLLVTMRHSLEARSGRLDLCASFDDVIVPIERLGELEREMVTASPWIRLDGSR